MSIICSMEQPKIELFTLTTGTPLNFALNKAELVQEGILGNKWFEELRVGQVSTRSRRGKHTTRNVSLLPLSGGGYLAGFNQPSLMKIRKMLEQKGPGKSSFNDCLHIGEPGCLVKGDWEIYPYYLKLLDEVGELGDEETSRLCKRC